MKHTYAVMFSAAMCPGNSYRSCLSVCMSVCLSVSSFCSFCLSFLTFCLSVLSVCVFLLSVCLSVMSVYHIYISVCLSFSVCVFLLSVFVSQPESLSIYLSVRPFFYCAKKPHWMSACLPVCLPACLPVSACNPTSMQTHVHAPRVYTCTRDPRISASLHYEFSPNILWEHCVKGPP